MGDLYVDATRGTNTVDRGDSPSDPLLTITFAVAEAVRRFGSSFTTIRASEGRYDRALGEEFPLLLPQNIGLVGAGRERTIIEYERDLADPFEGCLLGGREIASLTVEGHPGEPGACDFSVAIELIADDSHVHDVSIHVAEDVGPAEGAFGAGIVARDLRVQIDNVRVTRCGHGIECSGAVTVRACTFNENAAGVAPGPGACEVSECTFESGNSHGVMVRPPSGVRIIDCDFLRCVSTCISIERVGESAAPSPERPFIASNRLIVDGNYGIFCNSEAIVENNRISTDRGWGRPLAIGDHDRHPVLISASPEVRNNTFRRRSAAFDVAAQPLVEVGGACRPVFEGNAFGDAGDAETLVLLIQHDAAPDLGGGASGSRGGNRFIGGWIQLDADTRSIPREIFARHNAWRFVPPRRGVNSFIPGDYVVRPFDAAVVVHVDDAALLAVTR